VRAEWLADQCPRCRDGRRPSARRACRTLCHGTFVALGHYAPMMYRVALTLIRAILMTAAVVAVGGAAFLVASVALEWL